MCDHAAWLPPLVCLNDYGDPIAYLDAIYWHFRQDFVESTAWLIDRPVKISTQPIHDGREKTFWHIISDGPVEVARIPNPRRCERIRWPRPLIEGFASGERVIWWRVFQNGGMRLKIALPDFSYFVVLGDHPNYMFLITAVYADREHTRGKLRGEYERYLRELERDERERSSPV